MTKKAIIGAAVAALALAAGSAGAHAASSPTEASVAPGDIVFGDVVLETYFDLENTTSNPYSLADHTVLACVGADDDDPIEFGTYPFGAEIGGNGIFRTADPGFTGPPDFRMDLSELNSNDYDLRLVDLGVFPEMVVAHTTNGNPDQDCVDSLPLITP